MVLWMWVWGVGWWHGPGLTGIKGRGFGVDERIRCRPLRTVDDEEEDAMMLMAVVVAGVACSGGRPPPVVRRVSIECEVGLGFQRCE